MTFVTPIRTGPRRRWWSELLPFIAIVAVCLGAMSIPFALSLETWLTHLALRQEWTIKGPACAQMPEIPIYARGFRPPKPFTYKGTRFSAQLGDIFCEAVPDEGWFPKTTHAVCQFSNPSAIEVDTGVIKAIYVTGMGKRATVTVRNGRPSCVVGGWFDE